MLGISILNFFFHCIRMELFKLTTELLIFINVYMYTGTIHTYIKFRQYFANLPYELNVRTCRNNEHCENKKAGFIPLSP